MKAIKTLLCFAAAAALASCSSTASKSADNADAADTTVVAQESATPQQDVVIELGANDTIAATNLPVVIDFSATWCGPCQQFKPVYHAVAEKYAGKAVFATADVDVCELLAKKFNVSSIPYIVVLKTNGEQEEVLGAMSEADFTAFLDKALQ